MIDQFLSKLDKVRSRGNGKWMASCPCHEDKTPSLSIKDDNGVILLTCFSQHCTPYEIVSSIGMELTDLFPPSDNYDPSTKQKRQFHDACQILSGLAFESLVVFITAKDISNGKEVSDMDQQRLSLAISRIHAATEYTKRIIR